MRKSNFKSEQQKVLENADAAIKRSGMSAQKRDFALKLLKANEELRKLRMANVKPKRQKSPAKHR